MGKIIYIDGLEVNLTKKRIKRMNMRIKDPSGEIAISAPYGVPDKDVISFVRSKRNWIDKSVRDIKRRAEAHPAPANKKEKEERRTALKKRIKERLPIIEEATGLRCNGWTVRDMHTRWGSCNTRTHHINLSLMLATRNDTELDYVILHELVHTIVPDHGPKFYAMMDRFMPDWKTIRRNLHRT